MLQLPSLSDIVADPSVVPAPPPPQPRSIAPIAGLKSGAYGALSSLAGVYQGAAKIVGADDLANRYGATAQDYQQRATAAAGGLDQQSFTGNGIGGFLSKAAFTAGQALPNLVGAGVAGAGAVALLPEEGALAGGALVGRLGASLPKLLGGAGLGAGFAADVAPEALVAGAKTAATIGGAGAAMGVQSAGEQINTAAEQPGGLTRGDAARAFAQALPIGLVQGIVPGEGAAIGAGGQALLGTVRRGMLATVADHAVKNAAAGAIGSGLQAAADTSFDPNMSASERASRIVSAAVQGGEAGGLMGGVFGMLHRSPADQQAGIDQALGDQGLDPANPAGGGPQPMGPYTPQSLRDMARSYGPQMPEPQQTSFRFDTALQDTASGTQPSLFTQAGEGDAKGTFLPYDPGQYVPRAQRSDRDVMAEIKAARAARDQAAADAAAQQPAPPPPDTTATEAQALRQPDAPPPNAFMRSVLDKAGIGIGRGKGDFRQMVDASTATTMPELYNELAAIDPTSNVAQTASFGRLASRLGVGEEGMEQQLAALERTPENAQARAILNFKLGLRDAAARLKPAEEASATEAARPETSPASAPAPAAAAPVQEAAPTPAVKPPVDAVQSEPGKLFGLGADEPVATQEQLGAAMNGLLGRGPTATAEAGPAAIQADPNIRTADAGPRSIVDQVLDAARSAVGDKGGEVSIADIRKALPDVATKDVDAALREIHGDDSDNTLTQAPKGARTGVDGVSVPGAGKFHNLEVEAREAGDGGVQEQGAAAQAGADQPGGSSADGGGDAGGRQAAGAGEAQVEAEPAGAAQLAQQDAVAPRPQYDRPAGLPRDTPYPGDAAKAAELGVALPDRTDANGEAYDAVAQRLRGLHNMQTDLKQGSLAFSSQLRDARSTFGKVDDPSARLQPLPQRDAATQAAVAPAEPPPADPVKQAAAETVIAQGQARPAAASGLRRRAKAQTSLVETPAGDQVPTATVGGQASDLPQAAASAPDTLTTPVPVKGGRGKAPIDRELPKLGLDRMSGVDPSILPREQVQAHFDRFVSKLAPEVRANVRLVGADTPIEGRGPLGQRTTGLYVHRRDGTNEVYLNADAMHSRAEVEDALSHELFGHYGSGGDLRGPFREQAYQQRMNDVFTRAGGRDGVERLARQLGVWKVGDDGGNLNGGAGLSAYFPPDGQKLTPFLSARIADELIAHRAALNPSKLDLAIQQVQGTLRSGIVNVMRRLGLHEMARRMDRFGQPEMSDWVAQSRKALTAAPEPGQVDLLAGATTPRHFLYGAEPTGEPMFMARLGNVQRDSEGVMGTVDALRNRIVSSAPYEKLFGRELVKPGVKSARTPEALRNAGREIVENLVPANGIAEEAARTSMPSLKDYMHHGETERAIRTRLDGIGNRVGQDDLDIQSRDPAQARRLHDLMDVATANNLDPLRPFSDHTWLRDTNSPEDVEALRSVHARLQSEYKKLGQPGKGDVVTQGQQVYKDHVALGQMNWYMSRAMSTYDALRTVFDKVDTGYDPTRRFAGLDDAYRVRPGDRTSRQLAEDHFGNAQKARDYWRGEFERLTKLAEDHSTGEGTRPENVGSAAYADLADLVEGNRTGEAGYVKQGPYFRRGRSGDFAVGFKIAEALDAEGKGTGRPDPRALQALKAGFGKDFPQVSIGASDRNRQVFARFPSQEVASNFAAKVQAGGELRRYIDQEHGTHVSLLSDAGHMDGAVPFLQQHLDTAAAKFDAEIAAMPEGSAQRAAMAEQRSKYLGTLRATILDMAGDNSLRSIQSARENVQGSNADMLENQRAAAQTAARAASQTAVRAEKQQALFEAQQAVHKVGRSQAQNAVDKSARMQRILDAFNSRNAAADVRLDNSYLSTLKSALHSYQLGASPAYIIMNASQLGTLTLPELAKTHSYARTVAAMTGSTADTGRVLAAMVRTGGAIQGGITRAVLDGAGLSAEKRNFISTMANHDHLELGSYSAAESGLGVGNLGKVTKWMHFANSTALLAETASRLSTAFAAKKLYDEMPAGQQRDSIRSRFPTAEDYAGHVVKETMMQWGNYNSPKLFTAGGALGKAGPLLTQFHGWVPRIVEKVYRESLDGFTKRLGTGPEADAQRAEARRFVMAHMAAVTAISGGLGLPMAGYTAAAATRLSGLFYDQPYDFEAHLRGFMANTFGKDLGEVLSRGLPRYLGVDMGELGDEGWGPLSRLMEDRRKFEDAFPDYLAHAWGSAPGAALNMALGAREMAEGRFAEAGARALPTSLRNIVRAYQVNERGYVNGLGEKLPVPAGAAEVLKTALGMEGGDLAEERERQETVSGLKGDREYRQGLIKRDLSLATARNDHAGVASAMDAARKFDQDNPGMMFGQQLQGFLESRARAIALAGRLGTMGVDPKDRVARMLTGY